MCRNSEVALLSCQRCESRFTRGLQFKNSKEHQRVGPSMSRTKRSVRTLALYGSFDSPAKRQNISSTSRPITQVQQKGHGKLLFTSSEKGYVRRNRRAQQKRQGKVLFTSSWSIFSILSFSLERDFSSSYLSLHSIAYLPAKDMAM